MTSEALIEAAQARRTAERDVLERLEQGETFTIVKRGKPAGTFTFTDLTNLRGTHVEAAIPF